MTAPLLCMLCLAFVQPTADEAAKTLLDSARRAYEARQYPFAAARFREFLQKFGGHRSAPSARYGLGLALLAGPERDYDKAAAELAPLLGSKAMPEHASVLYHYALARRGQGLALLAKAGQKDQARSRFEEAGKQFLAASSLFLEAGKGGKEWALRSRCDAAEMLLRQDKPKEARAALALLTGDDAKQWAGNRYADLGLYEAGFAAFLAGDLRAAGKILTRKSIQDDEVFGTHARYLLARVRHKLGERAEARAGYRSVLAGYEAAKKAAEQKLRTPLDPDAKARLEKLARAVPDHVSRAGFYLGVLQYEDGLFAEALAHFRAFEKQSPEAALLPEARLRQGFCLVQSNDPKSLDEAIRILQPLADKSFLLADQALCWIARAQAAKGDHKQALETFRKAAAKAQQRGAGGKAQRGEILAEYGRAQQAAKQFREAAATFAQIAQEKLLPARDDEWSLDRATALQLAGDYAESEKECSRFLAVFKESPLRAALLFRQAENSAFQAQAAKKEGNPAERARHVAKHLDDAVARYAALVEAYPESPHVAYARQGMGAAWYDKGDLAKAQAALEAVPATDRVGDLAGVSLRLADILLRQCPARADDAVAAGKLEEKLKGAAELLEAFVGAAPAAPQVPDALLKLGYCRQRQAAQVADKQEKQKMLGEARAAYERILQKHAKDPAAPQALMERAKVLARMGDANGAMNELKKFAADAALKKTEAAPMALLALATLQRSQNKPAEAAATLEDCLKAHQAALQAQQGRAWQVGLLQYHRAAALREAGKLEEARQLFETVARASPLRAEGWDAALRAGQCLRASGEQKLAESDKLLLDPGLKPPQRQAAEKKRSDGLAEVRAAVAWFAGQEKALASRKAEGDDALALAATRSRLLYEAAWGWRALADREVAAARRKIQLERWRKRRDELARGLPEGSPAPQVAMPGVALTEVPLQPAEAQARATYQALAKAFPDLAVSAEARLELAELLAERGSHAQAVKLLQEALEAEKEPSAELTDKIKLRLGACLLDQGTRKLRGGKKAEGVKEIESALEQLQAVTSNDKSKMLHQAVYREAECLLQLGKADEAIKLLARFRDLGPYQNIAGLSDRACLRLGFALGEKKQWDQSRQAYQAVIDRTGGRSHWTDEARYGIAWAQQNQARYDDAASVYAQVVAATTTELAARAQLAIGQCRMAQKRYADAATALLVVPFTYDYPDLSALALVEAARALGEDKKPAQAVALLKRVLRDYPGSPPALAAQKRLADLGEK